MWWILELFLEHCGEHPWARDHNVKKASDPMNVFDSLLLLLTVFIVIGVGVTQEVGWLSEQTVKKDF